MATEPAAADGAAPGDAAKKKSGGPSPLLPALLALVVAPALTFAVAKFVLIPSLRSELAAPAGDGSAAAPSAHGESSGHGGGGHGKAAAAVGGNSYTFENVVVNLAGTMGTRYLKTTFLVTGPEADLAGVFEANKPALVDVTLNVLSSLSLGDLEEAGSKNLIREKLVQSYNQALGRKVAEQVFFSDFVVQ
ncbi:MAG: flagellar basal body-associated FliL family protein [Verrucomicrobiota bacterium]